MIDFACTPRRLARPHLWLSFLLLFFGLTPQAFAQALSPEDVPPALRPWIPWVLGESGATTCTPTLPSGEPSCTWPGVLRLDLDGRGGRFELDVFIEQKTTSQLPGDASLWPLEVKENGRALPVLEKGSRPAVELTPGLHKLSGRFRWERLPETLPVGAHTAFVELRVNGKDIPLIERDAGRLWLRGYQLQDAASAEEEQVELQVHRKLSDGVPLLIETRLVFRVAGRARELELPAPLVPGSVPLSLSGDLAVALDTSGKLRVQLAPGRHELTLVARTQGMPETLSSPQRPSPWPTSEVWVFEPNSELRVVELEGLAGIDASRTELPPDWRRLAAFSVASGDTLSLRTTRRGEPELPPNRLELQREIWLDEAAAFFTARDRLTGEMHQGWRLELLEGELGQVEIAGVAQVVTQTSPEGPRGVEVRDGNLDLIATARVARQSDLAAVGWSENVETLGMTLHLPPGWDVFAALGVDSMQDTWLSRWNLFGVFYVLVFALATSRLVNKTAGVVALVALVLSHAQDGAPEFVWLALLVFGTLTTLVRSRRWLGVLRFAFHATALTLVALLVTFSVSQIRSAIYPHLHSSFGIPTFGAAFEPSLGGVAAPEVAIAAPEEEALASARDEDLAQVEQEANVDRAPNKEGGFGAYSRGKAKLPSSSAAPAQKQFQPNAVAQTGPGVPDVTASTWHLRWSGPVVKDHSMRLLLVSPNLGRLLTVLRLGALGFLAYLLWRHLPRAASPRAEGGAPSPRRGAVAVGVTLLFAAITWPGAAHAEEPSSERLGELRARLTAPPDCKPDCLSVSEMKLSVGSELRIETEVHAGATVAYKLPGPASVLSSARVSVDGRPATALRLEGDGSHYLRLERGVHQVVLEARVDADRITLDLGSSPRLVHVDSQGWTVQGVNEDHKVESETITITREIRPTEPAAAPGRERRADFEVPPWFQVTRTISLGVTGSVETVITRRSDPSSPEVLVLPLLPLERLTTPGVEVRGQSAVVTFPREETTRRLSSTLSLPAGGQPLALSLTSPEKASYSELWELECGVVWHCGAEGPSAFAHLSEGRAFQRFAPWPGETLTISATAPQAAPGDSLTIERSTVTWTPGTRMSQGQLELTVRTSRSHVLTLGLPEAARLERVQIDGRQEPAKNEGGKLRLALTPGTHQLSLSWQLDEGLTTLFHTPAIDLGAPSTNHRIVVELPPERWLLVAGGPQNGPAILFWGYLILLVALALLLPKLPYNLLSRAEWLLLGLGLTQIPVMVALFVVGWFFLVGSRFDWKERPRLQRNFLQACLVVGTVFFLSSLTIAVYEGLVSSPDMEVQGAGSYQNHLAWYVDRAGATPPTAWIGSVSIWVWRAVMLAWALWLARALLRWLKLAWNIASEDGFWAENTAPRRRAPFVPPAQEPAPTDAAEWGEGASGGEPSAPSTDGGNTPREDEADAPPSKPPESTR